MYRKYTTIYVHHKNREMNGKKERKYLSEAFSALINGNRGSFDLSTPRNGILLHKMGVERWILAVTRL